MRPTHGFLLAFLAPLAVAACEAGELAPDGTGNAIGASTGDGIAPVPDGGEEGGTSVSSGSSTGSSAGSSSTGSSSGASGAACATQPTAKPLTIAAGGGNSWGIAVDATQVYWGIQEGGPSMRAAITGGAPTALGMAGGWTVAVDDTDVYSVDPGGNVLSCPKAGCTGAPRTVSSGPGGAMGVVVDDANVYWATNSGVYAAPKAGGTAKALATSGYPYEIALDDSFVYWTDNEGGVDRVAKTGGPTTTIADTSSLGSFGPMGLAVDGANAYFLTSDGKVWQVPKAGGPLLVLATDGGNEPWGIAVDATRVYYESTATDAIESVPIGGGCVTVLASGVGFPVGIAVDATNVYFATMAAVMSVPK